MDHAADIVTSYDEVGGCTLRQAYHRLVSEDLIPHTAPAYRRLSARLAQARREERFPDLVDPLREVHVLPARPDAGEFLRAAPDWFALDRTAGWTTDLYVPCEKDTLRAQLTGRLERTRMPVLVVRGLHSQSYVQVLVRARSKRTVRHVVQALRYRRTSHPGGIECPSLPMPLAWRQLWCWSRVPC